MWIIASIPTYIHEEVKSWSYMKFPFIRSRGTEAGWYRVGPLARVNNCDFIPTPLADAERRTFKEFGGGSARHATLAFHWARMIEMLHSAEAIQELLQDDDLLSDDLVHSGERQLQGVGVIEAPRGTLIHHYQINEDEQIVHANLIVATTHNNQAMNEAIRRVALQYLDGHSSLRVCSIISKWRFVPSIRVFPAPPMRSAKCHWKLS